MSEFMLEQENQALKKEIERLQKRLQTFEQHDALTGLLKANSFYQQVEKRFQEQPEKLYYIYYLDIERFKLFNEWYGRAEGDNLLCHIADYLKHKERECGGIAAHFNADVFVILLPVSREDKWDCIRHIEQIEKEVLEWLDRYKTRMNFIPAVGVYTVTDYSVPVSVMCDKAALAADSVKGNYTIRIAKYDGHMGQVFAKEQELLIDVKAAIENREFMVYMQPKCNMRTGKVIGAEALIRWKHPEKGMISPGEFIPVLEKNNFIFYLDMYIWEEVCKFIRRWLDSGRKIVPISVNVSRVDIFDKNLCEILKNLLEKYHLSPSLLELEITESAYTQNTSHIISIVKKLREKGFIVSMDDFGSGYSSLNMLKDVDVDILKIDMKFLDMTKQTAKRGSDILESVLQMAKWMNLKVIAEGIENTEQVDFLLRIGCEYGQGYYFYRPMDIQNFESVLSNEENVDHQGMIVANQKYIQFEDLLTSNSISDVYLNNILGAVAVYDIYDDVLELIQVNDGYYRVMNAEPIDLKNNPDRVLKKVLPQDRKRVWQGFIDAEAHPLLGAEVEFRRMKERKENEIIWVYMHIFFLGEQDGRKRFYASLTNITKQKKMEKEFQKMKKLVYQEAKITEMSDSDFEKQIKEKELILLGHKFKGDIFEIEVENDIWSCKIISEGLARYTGYSEMDYQDFVQKLNPIGLIHPIDRESLQDRFSAAIREKESFQKKIRVLCKDGAVFDAVLNAWYLGQREDKVIYFVLTKKRTSPKNKNVIE